VKARLPSEVGIRAWGTDGCSGTLPAGFDYLSASCLGKLHPLGPNKDAGGPGLLAGTGAFSPVIARVGDLGPTNASRSPDLAGRLSGRGRAARYSTRKTCPASDASRPPAGPAVNNGQRVAESSPSGWVGNPQLPNRIHGLR
jgi:hypothetical protein